MTLTRRPGLPAIEDVLAIPASAREVAPASWEDINGHVTVPAYYGFHMEAAGRALEELGWDEDYLTRTGQSLFSVGQHVRYYDEALVGHELSAHVRLLGRNERVLHAISIVVNHTTGRIANTLEFLEAHVDLTTRRTSPITPQLAQRTDELLATHRALPWTVPLNTGMGLR